MRNRKGMFMLYAQACAQAAHHPNSAAAQFPRREGKVTVCELGRNTTYYRNFAAFGRLMLLFMETLVAHQPRGFLDHSNRPSR